MDIDPDVDRLFARVFNTPLHKVIASAVYGVSKPDLPYKTTIGDDMVRLFESGVRVTDIPEPIKTYCDACLASVEAAKLIDLENAYKNDLARFGALLRAMPGEMNALSEVGFQDYLDKQRI